LRYFLLTLLALHCNSQRVIELSGQSKPIVQTIHSNTVPLRTVSGLSGLTTLGGLSTLGGVTTLGGLSNLGGLSAYRNSLGGLSHRYLNGLSGYNTLGSLGSVYGLGLGQQVVGLNGLQSVNIAPSNSLSYIPIGQQLQHLTVQQPASIGIARQLSIEQPASIAIARQQLVRPELSLASLAIRPQVYAQQQSIHPVTAAIHQIGRTVEYRPVPFNDQPIVPQVVEVEPSDQPINIHFKSRSSTVRLSQEHIPGEPGSVEQTQSQDEPHKVVHEVVKPVIQEVREVIQPYRQLTQEVQPVVENVHTVVSHGEGQRQQYVAQQIPVQQIQFQQVRPVQQIAVQQVRPVQEVQVQQVQPAISVRQIEAQPITYIQEAVPQQVQYVQQVQQPLISSYQTVQQPLSIQHLRAYQQPIALRVAQPVGVAQNHQIVTGVNRIVSQEQPHLAIRSNVRDQVVGIREVQQQRGSDFVKYAESD